MHDDFVVSELKKDRKELQGKVDSLHQQIGWLMGTLERIAGGEELGWTPQEDAGRSLKGFHEHFDSKEEH